MDERASRRRTRQAVVGVHALAAVLFLSMLCAQELGATVGYFGLRDVARELLPRVGILVAMEALLLLAARVFVGPLRHLFFPLVVLSHAILFLVSTVSHRYFLATGGHMDPGLAVYILKNAGAMSDLAGGGLDAGFAVPLGIGALLLVLAGLWSRRSWARPAGSPLVVEATLLLLGSAIWMGQAGSIRHSEVVLDQVLDGNTAADVVFGKYQPPVVRGTSMAKEDLPNVVVIMLESFRFDVVGAYRPNSPASDTPALDALAARGLLVENAYSTVTHTSKAIVGILCGGFPRLHTEIGESMGKGLPLRCLPKLLSPLGYRTRFLQSAGNYENRIGLVNNMGFEQWKLRDDIEGEEAGYLGKSEDALVEPARQWAEEAKEGGEPLFLAILTSVSHHPYHIPGEPPIPPEQWDDEHAFERYRNAVSHVDQAVGKIVAELEAVEPNTLFIIVSDHGEAFGENGPRGHNLVPFEAGVHIPMFLLGPNLPGAPGRIDGLRHQVDLVPTIFDYLEVEWNGEIPGISLFDEWGHDYVVSSCWQTRRCIAMRKGDLKFIHYYSPGNTRVYDLSEDPLELRDIANTFPRAVIGAAEARMLRVQADVEEFYYRADRTRGR